MSKEESEVSKKTLREFRKIIREENAEVLNSMIPKVAINYYRQAERMLEIYKPLQAILADAERYVQVEYQARSGSIVKFGYGSAMSQEEQDEAMRKEREKQYLSTKVQVESIERVIRQFAGMREFVAVRMYYFGEDETGADRPEGSERYTWDDIAEILGRDTRTVRRWKNNIINKVAACIGGMEAIKAEAVHWASGGLDNKK